MFNKIKERSEFPKVTGNPGNSIYARMGWKNVLLSELLYIAISKYHDDWSIVGAEIYNFNISVVLRPRYVYHEKHDNGDVTSCTTIEIFGNVALFHGVFEYQYGNGQKIKQAVQQGFENWVEGDLSVIIDSQLNEPLNHTWLEIESGDQVRQIIMGNLECISPSDGAIKLFKNMCVNCLYTETIGVFGPLIEEYVSMGIRLLISRFENGDYAADCRVDGLEFDAGKPALINYGKKLNIPGPYYIKQYIVTRSIDPSKEG